MGVIATLARKDLTLILRDPFGLFWMLAFPLLFALFFGFVIGGGDEDRSALPVVVVDEDQTDASRALVERLVARKVPGSGKAGRPDRPMLDVELLPREEARDLVRKGKRVAYIVIPRGGGEVMPFGPGGTPLEVGYDPRRSAEVGYLQGVLMETVYAGLQDQFQDPKRYKAQIDRAAGEIARAPDMPADQKKLLQGLFKSLDQFARGIDPKVLRQGGPAGAAQPKLEPVTGEQVQPPSAFAVKFPSAVLWGILGCVATFAISVVVERLQGTLLRLQVAPASWGQILAGKGLACFLACCGVALLLLLVGRLGLGVPWGSVPLLAAAVVCTAVCFTGILMFVSTLGKTPAGVAGSGWGIMMPMAMIGGGMIPLVAMPPWLQAVGNVSPVKWGILALEGAIWRGFSAADMLVPCAALLTVGAMAFVAGAQILSLRETGRAWLPLPIKAKRAAPRDH
jgi:ABC-2 type transport system permease protein